MARASAYPKQWQRLLYLSMTELPRGSHNEPSEELKILGDFFFGKTRRGGGSSKPMIARRNDGVEWRFESRRACARHFQTTEAMIYQLRKGDTAYKRKELNDWQFIYEDELERDTNGTTD